MTCNVAKHFGTGKSRVVIMSCCFDTKRHTTRVYNVHTTFAQVRRSLDDVVDTTGSK